MTSTPPRLSAALNGSRLLRSFRLPVGFLAFLFLFVAACSGSDSGSQETPGDLGLVPTPSDVDQYAVGEPLQRSGIGDVELVFDRYAATRQELIDLYKAQPWFKDGLTRDEELFVERGITFAASYSGPFSDGISRETIERKLYLYEVVQLSEGEVELMLIYGPGENAVVEMTNLVHFLPVLEDLAGIPYPEKVMVYVNGDFGINDFNEGQFVRVDHCCMTNPFILAHELAHTYWSVGPSWFNEGMADLYAIMVLDRLNQDPPEGWTYAEISLESFIANRRDIAARYPDLTLPQRFAWDGLYEAADVLLYEIRESMGHRAFAEAARHIYLASDYGRLHLKEGRLQKILLEYVDGEQAKAVEDLFNTRIWGDNGETYARFLELEALN